MDRIAQQVISSNQVLHNLSADESWQESMGGPTAGFHDTGSGSGEDFDQHESSDGPAAMSEEEHREQQEKLNADMRRLEHFLENFDYFSGRTMHKLRFHGQYLKAREVFYENMVVFPDLKP